MKKNILFSLAVMGMILGSRLLPHPPNFSPISAMLLLLPIFLPTKKWLSVSVFTALFLSDFFLGFYSTMLYVYGSYVLIGVIGLYAKKLEQSFSIFTLPFFSAFLFYTITNFGVWTTTAMYSHNLAGLLQSYWMGIPFLRMTLAGDFFFFSLIYALSFLRRQESRQEIAHFARSIFSSSNPVLVSGERKNL